MHPWSCSRNVSTRTSRDVTSFEIIVQLVMRETHMPVLIILARAIHTSQRIYFYCEIRPVYDFMTLTRP